MSSNFEVEEEHGGGREPSQCEKLCSSIFVAICIAPLLLIGACFLLGWNERKTVCLERAYLQGEAEAKNWDCSKPASTDAGHLIYMSCPITSGWKTAAALNDKFGSKYGQESYADIFKGGGKLFGARVEVQMLQCVEENNPTSKKDKNGKTVSVPNYSYSKKWMSGTAAGFKNTDADLQKKIKAGCGDFTSNPSYPADIKKDSWRVDDVIAGNLEIGKGGAHLIPIDTPVTWKVKPNGFHKMDGSTLMLKNTAGKYDEVGAIKVNVYTSAPGEQTMSALGKNEGGKITTWKAAKTWLCGEESIEVYNFGAITRDQIFNNLNSAKNAMKWILRILGFLLMWFALTRFFGPLQVMAECVPCIGPMLGDFVEAVVCVLSCPPACGCCLCVAGIVWVAMRPMVGIPMMICWCCCMGGMVAAKIYMKNQKAQQDLENQS